MYVLEYKQLHIVREEQTKNRTCQSYRWKQAAICESREPLEAIRSAKTRPEEWRVVPMGDSAAENCLYEKFKKYQVPASSVEDFRRRYTKPDRFAQRGPEYQAAVLQAARDDLAQFGYTIISRHDSVTGEVLAYYEPNEQEVSQ